MDFRSNARRLQGLGELPAPGMKCGPAPKSMRIASEGAHQRDGCNVGVSPFGAEADGGLEFRGFPDVASKQARSGGIVRWPSLRTVISKAPSLKV